MSIPQYARILILGLVISFTTLACDNLDYNRELVALFQADYPISVTGIAYNTSGSIVRVTEYSSYSKRWLNILNTVDYYQADYDVSPFWIFASL